MKTFAAAEIRNVALMGHAHSGKTTLLSALLRSASRSDDAGDVLPYDEEEIARGMTMALATAFVEWKGSKVNLIDTPGFHMFAHEARAAILPAESALIVVAAHSGLESMTDTAWKFAADANLPRILVLTQMDRSANSATSTSDLLASMSERWGRQVVPVQVPILDGQTFRGVIDLIEMKAFLYGPESHGVGAPSPIPPELEDQAKSAHEALVELVAEGKDELMDEFFAVGTIPEEHLITALHEAIREDRIFPVLYACGATSAAADRLLEFLRVYAPSAAERAPTQGARATDASTDGAGPQKAVERAVDDAGPATIYVYKTLIDPFAGGISYFKVLSGCIKPGTSLENYTRGGTERIAHPAVAQGRKLLDVAELHAGDLGAAAKLQHTHTGDTLGLKGQDIIIERPSMPEPAMTYAIEPKSRADEDRLAPALSKLMEEDLALRFYRDPQTNEFLLAGMGQFHIEAAVSRLWRRYHTEVTLKSPKVPYRETIRSAAVGHGRHKKQSGGHGQFGDCKIRLEPLARGAGFEFVNDIFGGAIPRQFIPAVEKGILESAARGYLAGHPMVDFRATVFEGSYHDVDSSELSFKMAAHAAFRACMEQARPALLEPVMRVEIEVPEEFAGAIIGDLNSRRARVQGMDTAASATVVKAQVPLAEMLSYGAILTAITQGKGTFRMEMDHYDFVPAVLADKIVSSAKRPLAEEA